MLDVEITIENLVKLFMQEDPLVFTRWALKVKKQYGVDWPMDLVNENNLIVRNEKEKD